MTPYQPVRPACGTCGNWGRPPGPEPRRYGYCFAKRAAWPLWVMDIYTSGDRGVLKALDRSPLMPDTDGQDCSAYVTRRARVR